MPALPMRDLAPLAWGPIGSALLTHTQNQNVCDSHVGYWLPDIGLSSAWWLEAENVAISVCGRGQSAECQRLFSRSRGMDFPFRMSLPYDGDGSKEQGVSPIPTKFVRSQDIWPKMSRVGCPGTVP